MTSLKLSLSFCSHNRVVVLAVEKDMVRMGMRDYTDSILKKRIEKAFPTMHFQFEEINEDEFNLALSRFFSSDETLSRAGNIVAKENDIDGTAIDRLEEDAPLINLLNSIFLEAISKRASDIHIESDQTMARVRLRIDGHLRIVMEIPSERAAAISSRLKLIANLNVLENRKPQDGRIDMSMGSHLLDVRISITPTICGESIVLRLLNRSDTPINIVDLGFSEAHLGIIRRILTLSSGLILVTGPTGSGKTTTLAAMLRCLNKDDIKIISIEDPVEYRISGITQIQTNEELGLTFDSLLRRVFRQDPDIIMIGEIRDTQTAELAIRAALTGHLVFATLHTNSAIEAVTRLKDMDIPSYLLASTLRTIIGQRLVRRYCVYCHGPGCSKCANIGYWGRTALAEVLPVSKTVSKLISVNASDEEILAAVDGGRFKSIRDDAVEKIASGITSEEEVFSELGSEL